MTELATARVETQSVVIGDYVARTRTEPFHKVTAIRPGPAAIRLYLEGSGNIRPRRTTKLWKVVQ